eukprot:Ihof_evm24s6 gene=Ihof_evmTU24s6
MPVSLDKRSVLDLDSRHQQKLLIEGWEEKFEPQSFTSPNPSPKMSGSPTSFSPRLPSMPKTFFSHQDDLIAVTAPESPDSTDHIQSSNTRRPSALHSSSFLRTASSPSLRRPPNLKDSFDDICNPFDDDAFDPEQAYRKENMGVSTFELLQREIGQLKDEREHLQHVIQEKEKAPTVATTMRALWLNEYCILELLKSHTDKLQLLDTAIAWYDGESITYILQFIKATSTPNLFKKALISRPVALDHWLFHLQSRGLWKPLSKLYQELGRTRDGIMQMYQQVFRVTDPQEKMMILQQCVEMCENALNPEKLAFEKQMIENHWTLLVRQLPIENMLGLYGRSFHKIDDMFAVPPEDRDIPLGPKVLRGPFPCCLPSFLSIVLTSHGAYMNRSVVDTLYYCCFYHYQAPEDRLSSPIAIQKAFEISEKQFTWIATEARAALSDWEALQSLFVVKGNIFKPDHRDVNIGNENLVYILARYKAPMHLLQLFLSDIKDRMERYHVAVRVNCTPVVIQ